MIGPNDKVINVKCAEALWLKSVGVTSATAEYSPHNHTAARLEQVLFTGVRVRVVVWVSSVL